MEEIPKLIPIKLTDKQRRQYAKELLTSPPLSLSGQWPFVPVKYNTDFGIPPRPLVGVRLTEEERLQHVEELLQNRTAVYTPSRSYFAMKK
jgi:hypothetical protein